MTQLTDNLMSEISSYRALNIEYTWLKTMGYEISPSDLSLSKHSFELV